MIPKHFVSGKFETVNLDLWNKSIYENLVNASVNRKLIRVNKFQRAIGKTTALINFAKDNGFYVLVGRDAEAKIYKKYFGYKNIRTINSGCLDGLGGVVVDEGCPSDKIQKLIDYGYFVVTGFVKDI